MNDIAAPKQAQDWSRAFFFRSSTYWPTLCFGRISAVVELYASHPAPLHVWMADVGRDDEIKHPKLKGSRASRDARIRGVACLVAQTN